MNSILNRTFFSAGCKASSIIRSRLLKPKNSLHCNFAKNMSKKSFTLEDESHIVWMDLEMTGLDVINDKILELSCLITDKDLNILVEGPSFAINYPANVFENMNDWCKKHHIESGLVEKCLKSQITQKQAEDIVLDFLKQNIPERKCPLAGNSIYMDR